MLIIKDPSTDISINLDSAEAFVETTNAANGSLRVRFAGSRWVMVDGLTYEVLERYNTENTGRIKLHKIEPLNFTQW